MAAEGSCSPRTEQGDAKRARTSEPALPAALREEIESALTAIGEVDHFKKSHKKGAGPVPARCLPPEALVHEKAETIRRGQTGRVHFMCSNPKCQDPIRNDRCAWGERGTRRRRLVSSPRAGSFMLHATVRRR